MKLLAILLIFVPAAIVAEYMHANPVLIFALAALGLTAWPGSRYRRGSSISGIAKSGAGIRAVEIDPVIAALESGAIDLPAHPDLQKHAEIGGRQLVLGEGFAQPLVDADRQRPSPGEDLRVARLQQGSDPPEDGVIGRGYQISAAFAGRLSPRWRPRRLGRRRWRSR